MSVTKRAAKKQERNGLDPSFRLQDINPMTDTQRDVFDSWHEGYNVLLHGVAGTGKTFIGMYLALQQLIDPANDKYKKIIVVRSCVQGREMGHLPGKPEEKMSEFEKPYATIAKKLFKKTDAWEILKAKKVVEFMSTSFLRGATFENCIIIGDEIENMSFQELDTIITRVGENCRIILAGDYVQSDLKNRQEREGLPVFMEILDLLEDDFDNFEFVVDDIVRSAMVKNYIIAKLKVLTNK